MAYAAITRRIEIKLPSANGQKCDGFVLRNIRKPKCNVISISLCCVSLLVIPFTSAVYIKNSVE